MDTTDDNIFGDALVRRVGALVLFQIRRAGRYGAEMTIQVISLELKKN